MARKTKAERDHQKAEDECRVWEDFVPKLSEVNSFVDAQLLVARSPRPNAPGRRYYSNLGFFLQEFVVPFGSNHAERSLYIQFIDRLDAVGALKSGVATRVVASLRATA